METQAQGQVFGWQQTPPPAGCKVWVVVPSGASAEQVAGGADAFEVEGPEEVLAVAGYMLLREPRQLDGPLMRSGPSVHGYREMMDGVPLPAAAAVLTGTGWYHLGVTAHASEGAAAQMCEEFNDVAGDDQPDEQTH